jgi:DNA-directed RNA polymerase specialized sigma24 family protein
VLEAAVDTLPAAYRTVFMLRDIEGLSTKERSWEFQVPGAALVVLGDAIDAG